MQTGALVSVWLTVSLTVSFALGQALTPQRLLGESIFKKQEECERYIGTSIEKILDTEKFDIHDFPIPDDDYHECKRDLDQLKRNYMRSYNVDKSSSDLLRIEIKDGSTEFVSMPADEGDEIHGLEFDLTEELCVNHNTCSDVLKEMEKEMDIDKVKYLQGRFAHCHILLDEIKQRYVKKDKLDEEKLKREGGMSVTCGGKVHMMPLPQVMNTVGYNSHGPFGDAFNDQTGYQADEGSPTVEEPHKQEEEKKEEENRVEEAAEEKEEHKEHPQPDKEDPEVKGTPSKAISEKVNLVSVVLLVLLVVKFI